MNKRYYVKKGASYKERVRCPLCGKLSPIGYFSVDHLFGIYRDRFGGRGDISCTLVDRGAEIMAALKEGISRRLKELLEQFTGMKYYSEIEMSKALKTAAKPVIATITVPVAKPSIAAIPAHVIKPHTSANIRPLKVVM